MDKAVNGLDDPNFRFWVSTQVSFLACLRKEGRDSEMSDVNSVINQAVGKALRNDLASSGSMLYAFQCLEAFHNWFAAELQAVAPYSGAYLRISSQMN